MKHKCTTYNIQNSNVTYNSYYEKFADGTVRCIDDEIPFEVPNGWSVCRLNDLALYRKGPFGSSLTKSMFVPKSNDSIKVYEQKNAIQKDYSLGDYFVSQEKFVSVQFMLILLKQGTCELSCFSEIAKI